MTPKTYVGLQGVESTTDIETPVAMRPKTFAALDAAFESYFHSAEEPEALANRDRCFCAWKAASLVPHEGLAEVYLAELERSSGESSIASRLAMEQHVSRLILIPSAMTQGDVAALQTAGLSLRQIVELSQIVAFVTYQARVLHGMRMWRKESL